MNRHQGFKSRIATLWKCMTAPSRAAAALRESEARYQALVERSPIPIGVHQNETIVFLNEAAVHTLGGASPDEFLGRSIWDFLDKEYHELARSRVEKVYHEGRETPITLEHFIRLDGTRIYVEVMGAPITYEGKPAAQIVFRDVTRRKEAEEALRESEMRYRQLVEEIQDVIFAVDLEGRFTYVSPAVERFSDFSVDEVLGKPFTLFVHPDDLEALFESFQRTLEGRKEPFEFRIFDKNGAVRHVRTSSRVILMNGQPVGTRGVMSDITARKRAEAERERLIAELEAKNAELEQFTYTVSHDLKSPLFTIRGFLGLLEEDCFSGNREKVKDDVHHIINATETMQRLLDDLLELSRIGRITNPPEVVSLRELAEEAAALVARQIEERGVTLDLAPVMPKAYGDRLRLREVFQNLLDNAVKFMVDQPEPRIEIRAENRGDRVVVRVHDNGPGIDERYHEKVFGLFERLDNKTEGTGIGLALAKRIVEVHGGEIWIESDDDGATFCFTLPVPP
ncbi:sensor histidine kinase [Rhodocaloribacter sp.]